MIINNYRYCKAVLILHTNVTILKINHMTWFDSNERHPQNVLNLNTLFWMIMVELRSQFPQQLTKFILFCILICVIIAMDWNIKKQ